LYPKVDDGFLDASTHLLNAEKKLSNASVQHFNASVQHFNASVQHFNTGKKLLNADAEEVNVDAEEINAGVVCLCRAGHLLRGVKHRRVRAPGLCFCAILWIMHTTYKATLRGDTLEWDGDAPAAAHGKQAVAVEVTIVDTEVLGLDSAPDPARGKRAADALRALAATNPFADVDAAAWEREIRTDRPLPGRE